MERILIPIDGSSSSQRALDEAVFLADAYGAELTLLYVLGHPDGDKAVSGTLLQRTLDKQRKDAIQMLEDINSQTDYPLETKVKVGPIAETIVKESENGGYDFIVMGTEGLGSKMKRLLIGSVTGQVLMRTKIPVLVVR